MVQREGSWRIEAYMRACVVRRRRSSGGGASARTRKATAAHAPLAHAMRMPCKSTCSARRVAWALESWARASVCEGDGALLPRLL